MVRSGSVYKYYVPSTITTRERLGRSTRLCPIAADRIMVRIMPIPMEVLAELG